MIPAPLHMFTGMILAWIITIIPVVRSVKQTGRWLVPLTCLSIGIYGLGILAVIPSILVRIGLPSHLLESPWTNVCIGYAALNQWGPPVGMHTAMLAVIILASALYLATGLICRMQERRSDQTT